MADPQEDTRQKFTLMANRNLLSVVILGAIMGALAWGIGQLLGKYLLGSVVCNEAASCPSAMQYGEITAAALVAIVALLGLVRLRIFRPLLVVLAVTACFWGMSTMLSELAWQWALLAISGLYALGYGLFVWIVRVRVFWIAMLLVIFLVIAVRWVAVV